MGRKTYNVTISMPDDWFVTDEHGGFEPGTVRKAIIARLQYAVDYEFPNAPSGSVKVEALTEIREPSSTLTDG